MAHSLLIIPLLLIVFVASLLYLYLHPEQKYRSKEALHMDTTVESMSVLLPQSEQIKMETVKSDMTLLMKIVNGIKKDKIACIIPSRDEQKKINEQITVILPESAAFGNGDAILKGENMTRQKNPLLQIVKNKESAIHRQLQAIQLHLDTTGDKFQTKFSRKCTRLKDKIDQVKSDVISECSRQRARLKHSYPHLANYDFIDESVFSNNSPAPPSYVHGTSVMPLTRTLPNTISTPGLIQER
jgi:hypothetical protein